MTREPYLGVTGWTMTQVGAMYMGGAFSPKSFAVAAEAAGFDSVWTGDHVFHYVDGVATLGCFAGCTERVTIGTSLLVAPLRPAVVTAKGVLTAAAAAGRRTIAGIGAGGEYPLEFEAAGADIGTRGRYTDEVLEVMRLLWTGDEVTFKGEWARIDGVRMEPVLATPPEIWVGGRSQAAIRRAVRFATGYLPYLVSPTQLHDRAGALAATAAEHERTLEGFTLGCTIFFVPGRSVEEAVDKAVAASTLSTMTPAHIRNTYLLGDDESCLERLRQYVEAGADHVLLGCTPGPRQQLEDFMAASGRLLGAARSLFPSKEAL